VRPCVDPTCFTRRIVIHEKIIAFKFSCDLRHTSAIYFQRRRTFEAYEAVILSKFSSSCTPHWSPPRKGHEVCHMHQTRTFHSSAKITQNDVLAISQANASYSGNIQASLANRTYARSQLRKTIPGQWKVYEKIACSIEHITNITRNSVAILTRETGDLHVFPGISVAQYVR
jgi:hypothetical protein